MTESRLLSFYRNAGTDHRGRTREDILAFDTGRLESTHDFIQWLFPLPEPSGANPQAPRLTQDDIAAFNAESALRGELLRSFEVMLRFYGLALAGPPGARRVDRAANYASRSEEWLGRPHNFLRISRILRSLDLLGCEGEARALLAQLEAIYRENAQGIGSDTLRYWRRAIEAR